MKRDFSNIAFTLIELVVALALISVIVLGIYSISSVLFNNSQDYGQRYLVKSQTQTTLNHILNNAALAIGSANTNDQGILHGNGVQADGNPGMGDANTICIHQAAGSNVTGTTLANDIWLCYTSAANQIYWCAEPYSVGASNPRGASVCNGSTSLYTGTSRTFLGTAYSSFSSNPPTFTMSASQLLFSITIQNCLNDATPPGTCNAGGAGISSDPVNNPEVQISGSVIPSQVSTG